MCGEEPRRQDGAAAAAVELTATCLADAAEQLRRQVQLADLAVRVSWEGGDCVRLLLGRNRLGEQGGSGRVENEEDEEEKSDD